MRLNRLENLSLKTHGHSMDSTKQAHGVNQIQIKQCSLAKETKNTCQISLHVDATDGVSGPYQALGSFSSVSSSLLESTNEAVCQCWYGSFPMFLLFIDLINRINRINWFRGNGRISQWFSGFCTNTFLEDPIPSFDEARESSYTIRLWSIRTCRWPRPSVR